jgi:hypothetical protein
MKNETVQNILSKTECKHSYNETNNKTVHIC